jgi:Leucine-rich repeat (LRR) protein
MKKHGMLQPVGRFIVGAALLLGTSLRAPAQSNQVDITGMEWSSGQFHLLWDQAVDRYIVEQFDLQDEERVAVATSTGVLDIAATVYPDADALSFFRVRSGIAAVFFRDPVLEAVIRSAIAGQRLGPTNWVYDAELASLSELRLSLVGLSHVAGLGAASSLATLDAGGNSLQSLVDLAGCTSLQSLRLDGNELTSLQGLETLQQLQLLDVSQNLLMSLEPLAGLLNLRALYAEGNQVTDLAALSGMTQLGLVDLSDNAIRDLTPLLENASRGGLGSGDVVYLSGNPLEQPAQVAELRGYGVLVHFP